MYKTLHLLTLLCVFTYGAGTGTLPKLRGKFSTVDAGAALKQFAYEGR
ncbi:MAG: hypothetical protein Q4C67_08870 [Deinococcus sp.]|nr:hypothetical protein [Deinococcus sp.]